MDAHGGKCLKCNGNVDISIPRMQGKLFLIILVLIYQFNALKN